MSLLDIQVLGAPILRATARDVDDVRAIDPAFIEQMFETMYAARGIGLAAPQVGVDLRLAVVDVDGTKLVLINPEITRESGAERAEEGCLSIPEVLGDVDRAAEVTVRALNPAGETVEVEATGLLARCMQHEIDHLNGKLFIDYLSFFRKKQALSKWETVKVRYPGNLRRLTPEELERIREQYESSDGER